MPLTFSLTRCIGICLILFFLTAWSTAGILGPVLINYIRQAQVDAGIPPVEAYSLTMYIMAALLLIGFLCNLAIKEVDDKHHIPEAASSPSKVSEKEKELLHTR